MSITDIAAAMKSERSAVRSSFPNYNKRKNSHPASSKGKKGRREGFFIKKTVIPAPRLG